MKPTLKILATLAALGLSGCGEPEEKEYTYSPTNIYSVVVTGNVIWQPRIGDRVRTHYGGSNFVTVITNVVNGGSRSQTGVLVYGQGLPGVDSWWVTPAP